MCGFKDEVVLVTRGSRGVGRAIARLFPPEVLADFHNFIVPVETGDLCLFTGNLVHGVLRGEMAAASKKRLLITFSWGRKMTVKSFGGHSCWKPQKEPPVRPAESLL